MLHFLSLFSDPEYTAVLSSSVNAKFSGDPTELECKVMNVSNLRSGRLGVSWLYRDVQPGGAPGSTQTVTSLDENGTLVPGRAFKSRVEAGLITATRAEPSMFKLRLLHTTDADAGEYMCAVTAWIPSPHGHWKKVAEHLTPAVKVSFANKRKCACFYIVSFSFLNLSLLFLSYLFWCIIILLCCQFYGVFILSCKCVYTFILIVKIVKD